MKVFDINKGKISRVKTIPFKLEREIQEIVENNVEEFFDLDLITTEYRIKSFRFDTLCFDKNTNSFVIIEYKNTKSYSVIDQGYTYMSLLLNNKSDFVLEYNEKKNKNLRRDDVDWTQSRILFVSPNFTEYQKNSINFKDIPFELWEIKRFQNNTIVLNQIILDGEENISTTTTLENNVVKNVSREVKLYTEERHTEQSKVVEETKNLYFKFRERLLEFGDDIEIRPRKEYIGFIRRTNLVDVELQSKNLKLYLNLKKGLLDDPKNMSEDVSTKGHYGNGDYMIKVFEDTDLDYVMFLVKQSYIFQKE